jgi:vacuolar-type H+-ATPase subunit H
MSNTSNEGFNEPVNVKKPGFLNQVASTLKESVGMSEDNTIAGKLGEIRNKATAVIADQTGKAGNQATKLAGQAVNTYGQARNQVMNRVSNAQNRGKTFINTARNTATSTMKTAQNTARATLATATNEAQKRVENLKGLHSNATGTTAVIAAIKKNGKKTRRHIRKHMDHLARKVEASCGKTTSNAITVGGRRKTKKGKKGKKGRKSKKRHRKTKRSKARHTKRRSRR